MIPDAVANPTLIHGDCIDAMRDLPSASVDVVVTDPPAGIGFMHDVKAGRTWDSFKTYEPRTDRGREVALQLGASDLLSRAAEMLGGLALNEHVLELAGGETSREAREIAAELRAMSKMRNLATWERGFAVFLVDVWTEVDRVLKPGAFVCAWALPKTADLAGLAMRLVGWERHETVLHLFGVGMAKAGDIGKQIDKAAGVEREVVGMRNRNTQGWEPKGPCKSAQISGPSAFKSAGSGDHGIFSPITNPVTEAAKRWTGWHSQLAPGHEQWLIGRKPTRLTYAQQVQTHGCGAFNIGATRIPRGEGDRVGGPVGCFSDGATYGAGDRATESYAPNPSGSMPRNVVLTTGGGGCPAEGIDRLSGPTTTSGGGTHTSGGSGASWSIAARGTPIESYDDNGAGASKYFTRIASPEQAADVGYYPKARDRRAGLAHGSNQHPTHKHVDLMRWLVRLMAVTDAHTGGDAAVVLDPFMGSGTTGVACVAELVRFIGIEREAEHFDVARARILTAIGSPDLAAEVNEAAPDGAQLALL